MSTKPAWQRLGLKLKSANDASGIGHRNTDTQVDRTSSTKRKLDHNPSSSANPTSASSHPHNEFKKARRDDPSTSLARPPPHLKKQKSVTFSDTPTKNDNAQKNGTSPARPHKENTGKPPPKQSKSKSKGPAKKEKKQTPPSNDLTAALEYLRQWGSSRDTWKFNKNHQSSLIGRIFDITDDGIPAADVGIFYQYIRDLKGFVRARLREMALEIRTRDEADGAKAWPENMTGLEEKQKRYESLISEYWTSPQARKRKSFSETDFLANSDDDDPIIRRVVKRLRAEMVFMELSDGEETDVSTTSTHSSSRAMAKGDAAATTPTPMDLDAGKKVKLNDGSARRKRKLRTGVDSDDDSSSSSSSESESDGDSDTSSSGSSSEDSDDSEDEMEESRGYESSSSSSSSSSGEDDSRSESDDEEEL